MTEEQREYQRKYREMNKSRVLDRQKKWRENNQENIRQLNPSDWRSHSIYLLELTDSRLYVGSTTDIDQRLRVHRQDSKRKPECNLYKAVSECGGWNKVKIHVLMRDIPNYDLRLRLEQHFIDMIPDHLRLNVRKVQTQKAS